MAPNTLPAAPRQQTGRMLPEYYGGVMPGLPGWDVRAAQQYIDVPDLRWPLSVHTFEAMRREPQIQGLMASATLPIRHMQWYVDPKGTSGTVAQEIAEDFGLPLLGEEPQEDGTGVDFDDLLRLGLLALALGHQFFEEAGDIEGVGNGQKYRLRSLMQYPQHTIARINVTPTGDLRSVQQYTVTEQPEVAADRLLTFVWDREGANWAGRPLLYGLYWAWRAKIDLLAGDVATKRRFGGIPVVEATIPDVGREAAREAAEMAMLLQSGDGAGVFMPYGTTLRLLGVEGSLPDAIGSARYHDEQMARAFMQMFAELGKTQSGSRALGTTLLDHYVLGVLAVAKWAAKSLMVLVKRIVERNYGVGTQLPQIGFRQDDHEDITIADLAAAVDAGIITVDDDLEAQVRDRSNLVQRNPDEPARVKPATSPPTLSGEHPVAAAAGDPPPIANAGVDFQALQATFLAATARLKRRWADVTAQQIDNLVAQVQAAQSVEDLATITLPPAGADVLAAELVEVMHDGIASAQAEAAHQGVTLPAPDRSIGQAAIEARSRATAALLARSLADSAASKAVSIDSASVTGDQLAQQVREHLEGLVGATQDYELAGAVTQAQNEGRMAVIATAPAARIYASELNDSNECEFCAQVDGTEYASLADARRDYGSGHYVGCLGGNRCRGTLVAVYGEA